MEISSHASGGIDVNKFAKLNDLSMTNKEVLQFINESLGDDTSPLEQQALVTALAQRNQLATTVSNISRMLADGITAIIRNLRA